MQVHRADTPSGLELGGPPSSPSTEIPATALGGEVMSDSSEFDKYKDFPMEPTEMYARIEKLKGFRRSKSQDLANSTKAKRWRLPKKTKEEKQKDLFEMGDDKSSKDQLEEVKENKSGRKLDIDGREGIRKAFSSVLNLLSQPQVACFGDTSTILKL